MSFQKTPGGTRGARIPPSNAVTRALGRVMMSWHRRSGDKFQGQDLLYLTTVGAKTGQKRQTAVARFPDGEDAWLVSQHRRASRPGMDRIRRPSAAGDARPARRSGPRAGMAANYAAPAALCRVRAEDRPPHPRHPALPRRLSPHTRHCGPSAARDPVRTGLRRERLAEHRRMRRRWCTLPMWNSRPRPRSGVPGPSGCRACWCSSGPDC